MQAKYTLAPCEHCGTAIRVRPFEQGQKRFCSRPCWYASRADKKGTPRRSRETRACRHCQQPFETIVGKKKQYCSRTCRYASKTVTDLIQVVCEGCGTSMELRSFEAKTRRYCSRECANTAHRVHTEERSCLQCGTHFRAIANRQKFCSRTCFHRWGTEQTTITCETCGTVFKAKMTRQRFCSQACRAAARRTAIQMNCAVCGKEMTVWRAREGRTRYCSKHCMYEAQFSSNEERHAVAIVAEILGETPHTQHSFPWLRARTGRMMHVDAYFPRHNLAVEYDGKQHRQFIRWYHRTADAFARLQQRDADKDQLLAAHGITLLRVRDDEPRTEAHLRQRLAAVVPIAPGTYLRQRTLWE